MAGATDTTLSSAIGKYVSGVAVTVASQATPLRSLMMNLVGEGDSVDWIANSASNTSTTTFSEGDSASAAGYMEYYAMTLAKSSFQYRTMYQITGTALDSLKKGAEFNGIEAEALGAIAAHYSFIEDNTVTTLEAAIDSGGSYAGQTRANSGMTSMEAAVTPTVDEMDTAHSAMIADPRSCNWAELAMLAPIEFQQSYGDVATGASSREHIATQGGTIDAGTISGLGFNGKAFTTIGTMTDTTCLITAPNNLRNSVWRDTEVSEYAKNTDSFTYAIVSVIIPWVFNPYKAGKLT